MLTVAQLQAISLIAAGHTHVEVSKAVGITTRTIQNWHKDIEFSEAVFKAKNGVKQDILARVTFADPMDREEEIEQVVKAVSFNLANRLTGLIPDVLDTLEEILKNNRAKDSDRIRAGQVICDLAGLTRANTVNVNVGTQSMDQTDLKELPDEQFRELIGLPANLDLSRVSDEDVMRLAGVEDTEWNQDP